MNRFASAFLAMLGTLISLSSCKGAQEKTSEQTKAAKIVAGDTALAGGETRSRIPRDAGDRFKTCRSAFNARDEATLRSCYDDASHLVFEGRVPTVSATGAAEIMALANKDWAFSSDLTEQAQLVLRNGERFAAVVLTRGTSDDESKGLPAGSKSLSTFQGELVSMSPSGKVKSRQIWIDQGVLAHQLGTEPSERAPDRESAWAEQIWQVAEGSERETANLLAIETMRKAQDRGDLAAYETYLADDVSFRYVGEKDARRGRVGYLQGLQVWAADPERRRREIWAAGDWVVAVHEAGGATTSTLEFFQLGDGKLRSHWIFESSPVHPPKSAPAKARVP